MQTHNKNKHLVLLFALLMSTIWCGAVDIFSTDGYSLIGIKEGTVQGPPKGFAIQATLDGHLLTVVFTENLGEVAVEITTATGSTVDYMSMITPNGYQFYITNPGDYIITFTLENGDEYYGEFTVTE